MIVGIMSDSHGNLERTQRAINAIRKYDPVHVFHCGDICSQAVITEIEAGFLDPEIPVTCVLGNCDSWSDGLSSSFSHIVISNRFAEVTVGDKKIAVIHGDDLERLERVCSGGKYDYVFTGHTHVKSDDRINRTRVINPGALHRASEPSCAVLDLKTDTLTTLYVS